MLSREHGILEWWDIGNCIDHPVAEQRMSKRSKKNRRAKLPVPGKSAKRGIPRLAVAFLAIVIPASLGFWWWKVKSADILSSPNLTAETKTPNPAAAASGLEFQKLTGRWQRLDGGYIMEVKSIASNGSIDAAYFNPKPIHIAKAEASRDGAVTRVFVELRDTNYPGSTYSLTYDPASDQLKGIYFQAVEQQRFPVEFVRLK